MPPAPVDPARVRALSSAVARLQCVASGGAEDLLCLYPEAGERALQDSIDGLLEQGAALLEGIEAAAAELGARLDIAAADAPAVGLAVAPGSEPGDRSR